MALYRAVVMSLINKITHYFMLKSHKNSLMTLYLRDFDLMTPQTGIFNKILPISGVTKQILQDFTSNKMCHCGVLPKSHPLWCHSGDLAKFQ